MCFASLLLGTLQKQKKRGVCGGHLHFSRKYLTPATFSRPRLLLQHGVYLRFLKNGRSSLWQRYSKPTSSKALASSSLLTTLTVRALMLVGFHDLEAFSFNESQSIGNGYRFPSTIENSCLGPKTSKVLNVTLAPRTTN